MRQGQATPVRKKVQRLEERLKSDSGKSSKRKRGSGGQGRPPSPLKEMREAKQERISNYFKVKSPKVDQARSRRESVPQSGQSSQETTKTKESTILRGPMAPFWEIRGGSVDHPTAETLAKTSTS